MTNEEFDRAEWGVKTRVQWRTTAEVFKVLGVDFGKRLIGIPATEPEGIFWMRCKVLTIVPEGPE